MSAHYRKKIFTESIILQNLYVLSFLLTSFLPFLSLAKDIGERTQLFYPSRRLRGPGWWSGDILIMVLIMEEPPFHLLQVWGNEQCYGGKFGSWLFAS